MPGALHQGDRIIITSLGELVKLWTPKKRVAYESHTCMLTCIFGERVYSTLRMSNPIRRMYELWSHSPVLSVLHNSQIVLIPCELDFLIFDHGSWTLMDGRWRGDGKWEHCHEWQTQRITSFPLLLTHCFRSLSWFRWGTICKQIYWRFPSPFPNAGSLSPLNSCFKHVKRIPIY